MTRAYSYLHHLIDDEDWTRTKEFAQEFLRGSPPEIVTDAKEMIDMVYTVMPQDAC